MDDEAPTVTRLPGAARAGRFAEPQQEIAAPPRTPSPGNSDKEGGSASPSTPPTDSYNGNTVERIHRTSGWERFQPDGGGVTAPPPPARMHASGWTPPPPKEKPAEWGRKRTLIRVLSLGMARAKASAEELEFRHNVRTIRDQAWTRCVRIVVANPKGGVGKTPTSLILAGTIAQIRGGGVVAWDANQSAGTLRSRAEGMGGMCVSDVAANPTGFSSPGAMAAAVVAQSSFAHVLGARRPQWHLDDTLVERVQVAIDSCYQVSIADTGGNESRRDASFRRLMQYADQLVIPVTATKDAVDKAQLLLADWADLPGGLAQRAVVAVLDAGGPKTPGLAAELAGLFTGQGISHVVQIPYDRVIADGTAITVGDLSHQSSVAWTRLAAATLSSIVTKPERY